jgi:putative transposase
MDSSRKNSGPEGRKKFLGEINMELKHNKHSVGEASFHIVFCPKYRHGIFAYVQLMKYCKYVFEALALKYNFTIRALKIMSNHVHLFVSIPSKFSISQTVKYFKGISSRKIFQVFPWLRIYEVGKERFWGGHFWSRGYFYRSVGSTTDKAVEFYIKVSQNDRLKKKYYTSVGKSQHQGMATDPYVAYLQGELNIDDMRSAHRIHHPNQKTLDVFHS